MKINVTPVPAPRMSQADRWRKRPAVLRYFAYRDVLKEAYGDNDLPAELRLQFIMPMPNSWSMKKRRAMDMKPHQQRPDIDNLQKAVQDSLALEDSYIYRVEASKYWGEVGSVTIERLKEPTLLES